MLTIVVIALCACAVFGTLAIVRLSDKLDTTETRLYMIEHELRAFDRDMGTND